jgi:SAM-dependent methyltransferase
VELVYQVPAGPVLDAGCGEGWLTRELAARGLGVQGIDASAAMVELAEHAGAGRCRVLPFAAAAAEPRRLRGPFGTIVFAESLLAERITPMLMAAGATLFPYGRILIENPHPAAEPGAYADGWRWMDEAAPGMPLPHRIPRYFRTVGTWLLELRRAGLILIEIVEPLDEAGRPASLILVATIPERRGM